ncbi:hypothetical protein CAOG_03702 [Capsaspora owczarzaki ATCC 30864]|uniref:RING-type domain-containing protein n=1 Tax=Capsaspora owczarzaki (strain ATCC 30864) TaxID=595528 RepID=A0A0D2VQA6_CAPO3|nr:hypothetical protein CAOG_03702 [Capsaspora owczarzaki ATCC 30864]KJE92802.1 hypothetical protein CAOG_003702 [Capsaspora owczarzaki ATCC 30864]|eukprot:XP_004363430.1 hypothetical protein CAOG_03702 [Capsaspora owczarzaki ATCC 30864]
MASRLTQQQQPRPVGAYQPVPQHHPSHPSQQHRLLVESESMSSVLEPLATARRIKYTCLDVSRRYLAFGANSGGLYVFDRLSGRTTSNLATAASGQTITELGPTVVVPSAAAAGAAAGAGGATGQAGMHRFLLLLASKHGALTCIKFAPNDNVIAMGTVQGIVLVWQLNLHRAKLKEKQIVAITEHRNSSITALEWDDRGQRLFSGDDTGRVFSTSFSRSIASIFRTSDLMMRGDSRITQLQYGRTPGVPMPTGPGSSSQQQPAAAPSVVAPGIINPYSGRQLLIASTLTRCTILDTSNRQAIQVGKKPRDGTFGACVHIRSYVSSAASAAGGDDDDAPAANAAADDAGPPTLLPTPAQLYVYAARPGSRLWEASDMGVVLSTLSFRKTFAGKHRQVLDLKSAAASPDSEPAVDARSSTGASLSTSFISLSMLVDRFALAWNETMLAVLDPVFVGVIEAHVGELTDIRQVVVYGEDVYILHDTWAPKQTNPLLAAAAAAASNVPTAGCVSKWSFITAASCIVRLCQKERWLQAALLASDYFKRLSATEFADIVSVSTMESILAQLRARELRLSDGAGGEASANAAASMSADESAQLRALVETTALERMLEVAGDHEPTAVDIAAQMEADMFFEDDAVSMGWDHDSDTTSVAGGDTISLSGFEGAVSVLPAAASQPSSSGFALTAANLAAMAAVPSEIAPSSAAAVVAVTVAATPVPATEKAAEADEPAPVPQQAAPVTEPEQSMPAAVSEPTRIIVETEIKPPQAQADSVSVPPAEPQAPAVDESVLAEASQVPEIPAADEQDQAQTTSAVEQPNELSVIAVAESDLDTTIMASDEAADLAEISVQPDQPLEGEVSTSTEPAAPLLDSIPPPTSELAVAAVSVDEIPASVEAPEEQSSLLPAEVEVAASVDSATTTEEPSDTQISLDTTTTSTTSVAEVSVETPTLPALTAIEAPAATNPAEPLVLANNNTELLEASTAIPAVEPPLPSTEQVPPVAEVQEQLSSQVPDASSSALPAQSQDFSAVAVAAASGDVPLAVPKKKKKKAAAVVDAPPSAVTVPTASTGSAATAASVSTVSAASASTAAAAVPGSSAANIFAEEPAAAVAVPKKKKKKVARITDIETPASAASTTPVAAKPSVARSTSVETGPNARAPPSAIPAPTAVAPVPTSGLPTTERAQIVATDAASLPSAPALPSPLAAAVADPSPGVVVTPVAVSESPAHVSSAPPTAAPSPPTSASHVPGTTPASATQPIALATPPVAAASPAVVPAAQNASPMLLAPVGGAQGGAQQSSVNPMNNAATAVTAAMAKAASFMDKALRPARQSSHPSITHSTSGSSSPSMTSARDSSAQPTGLSGTGLTSSGSSSVSSVAPPFSAAPFDADSETRTQAFLDRTRAAKKVTQSSTVDLSMMVTVLRAWLSHLDQWFGQTAAGIAQAASLADAGNTDNSTTTTTLNPTSLKLPRSSLVLIGEVMTSCLKWCVVPVVAAADATAPSSLGWNDASAQQLLTRYFYFLDRPRAFAICNQQQSQASVQLLLDLEDRHSAIDMDIEVHHTEIERGNVGRALDSLLKDIDGNLLGLALRYLTTLFTRDGARALAYSVASYPRIQPWNVEKSLPAGSIWLPQYYTQLVRAETTVHSHLPPRAFFANDGALILRWLTAALEITPVPDQARLFAPKPPGYPIGDLAAAALADTEPVQGPDGKTIALHDWQRVATELHTALEQLLEDSGVPSCLPLAQAHRVDWQLHGTIRHIISHVRTPVNQSRHAQLFDRNAETDEHDDMEQTGVLYALQPIRAVQVCIRHGYWLGAIELLAATGQSHLAIALSTELGDIELLQRIALATDDWEAALDWIAWRAISSRSESLTALSCNDVVRSMIPRLGARNTLELLVQRPMLCDLVSHSLIEQCVYDAVISAKQDSLLQDTLEAVDTYLWSLQQTPLAPQLRQVVIEERAFKEAMAAGGNDKAAAVAPPYLQLGRTTNQIVFDHNVALPRFLEEPLTHWGVSTALIGTNCPCCMLALSEKVGAPSKVIIFECGHGFHHSCLPEDACAMCLSRRVKSVAIIAE